MPTTADLYTTVQNTSGKTLTFSYLGKHGRTLASNGQYTVWGHIQHSFGHGEIAVRKKKALERDLLAGKLTILSTPSPVYYDAVDKDAYVSISTLGVSSNVATVVTSTPHGLLDASVSISTRVVSSNVVTVTTSQPHGYKLGDSVFVNSSDSNVNGVFVLTSVATATTFTYAKTTADTSSAVTGTVSRLVAPAVTISGVSAVSGVDYSVLNGTYTVASINADGKTFTFAKTTGNLATSSDGVAGGVVTPNILPPAAALTGTGNTGTASGFAAGYYGFAITFVNKYGETTMGSSAVKIQVTADKTPVLTLPVIPTGCTVNVYMTTKYATSGEYDTALATPTTVSLWRRVASGVNDDDLVSTSTRAFAVQTNKYVDSATFDGSSALPPSVATYSLPTSVRVAKVSNGVLGLTDPSWGKAVV